MGNIAGVELSDDLYQRFMDPYYGAPKFPDYKSVYDPYSMAMAPGYKQELDAVNPDQRGIDQFRKEALRGGSSPWADLATSKSYGDEARARDTLSTQAVGNAATARSDLAMRGGSSSGARERVATSANRDLLNQSQDLSAQGMGNRSQIGINDEQNRITQLGLLPGMDQNNANFALKKAGLYQEAKAGDLTNQLKENENLNAYNLSKFKTQGEIWGAGQQANATANADSGGSWICTEAAANTKRWNPNQGASLRKLKRYSMKRHAVGTKFYIYYCHELTRRMKARGDVDWAKVRAFIREIIFLVDQDEMDKAFVQYVKYTRDLISKYWPDCQANVYLQIRKEAA